MRAVAYVRVSSEDQVQGTSLDSQVQSCVDYAKSQGIELRPEDIYREEGFTATKLIRPKLGEMLKFCTRNKGKIQVCLIWKVSRLARKSEHYLVIKAKLANSGIRVVSTTEPIDDGPIGTMLETILAAWAQLDNDVRTQTTSAGSKARTLQGGWVHGAPYGYSRARSTAGLPTLVPDKLESPVMTQLLEEFSSGNYTVKQMIEVAYKMGVRTKAGGRRSWQVMHDLLANPVYAGLVNTKFTDGQTIKGIHKPLISETTHYRILAILAGNIKNYSKHAELEWPLRGGFIKHTCGKALTGSSPKGRNGPSPRYSCPVCRASKSERVSKRREEVHDDFLALLRNISPDEPSKKLFKEVVLKRWNNEFKDAIGHNARLNQEMEACNTKKSRILDLYIDGKLNDFEKEQKLKEVEEGIAELKLQVIEADKYIGQKEEIIDKALMFMSDAESFWNLSDIRVKKQVQDTIFPEGLTYDFNTGFGTVKLAESYLLITKSSAKKTELHVMAGVTGLAHASADPKLHSIKQINEEPFVAKVHRTFSSATTPLVVMQVL